MTPSHRLSGGVALFTGKMAVGVNHAKKLKEPMNNIATITAVIMSLNVKRNMNIDAQYERDWMKPIINKVGKIVPFPALYLNRIISPNFYEAYDPFNNLVADLTSYLLRETSLDTSLYNEVKEVLTTVLKDTVGKFLDDRAEEFYHVRTNMALRYKKEAIPQATPKEYIPMDKDEAILTSDELLEEEASFYPDDDMLKRRVKQRKKARYERQYRRLRKGDIIPAEPDDLFDKV